MKNKTKKGFRPKIRSRHPSHQILRSALPFLPVKSVIRFGSTTELTDTVAKGGDRIEINTTPAVKTSASKLLMKKAFKQNNVVTADWVQPKTKDDLRAFFQTYKKDGIVLKSHYGSRGLGNSLIRTSEELERWFNSHPFENYIAEKFYNFNREYRIHVTFNGCFYTCRKMLKKDIPEQQRWFRNDANSIWVLEENEQFDKPINWGIIVQECVKALKAVGLDVGAIDVKVQSTLDKKGLKRPNPEFIILETNSAPSFGEVTLVKYKEILPLLIKNKANI